MFGLDRGMAVAVALLAAAPATQAQPEHEHPMEVPAERAPAPAQDGRTLVHFPEAMRRHTLANMRDHLRALQEIQQALAGGEFAEAAKVAERRLGMSALEAHGAFERAEHMPEGMREIGSAMHRSASRFAIAAEDAAVTGDVEGALDALARVTSQCVACHDAYRVQ